MSELSAFTSRREFLRLLGIGGALVLLPPLFSACEDSSNTGGLMGPGTGSSVTIDFAKGDVAVLQFAYVLEQLEADFYSKVVASFANTTLTDTEKLVLTDIRNHELVHRELLKAALGPDATFTITGAYATDFTDRVSVLASAKAFEDLGVAAYNGAAQYFTDVNNLLLAAKIVSVEARHSAAVRDMISALSGDFAPTNFDNAFSLDTVAFAAQKNVIERLEFLNAPTTFVQGPNNNGTG